MRVERRGELHRHAAFVAAKDEGPTLHSEHAVMPAASGVSLLRLSVSARFLIVAAAAALLWTAVLWALQ
jgi:hypothetical protein